jgi:hypothetical protein
MIYSDRIQRLLYQVDWNAKEARDILQDLVIESWGEAERSRMVDKTGLRKKGTHSVWGQRRMPSEVNTELQRVYVEQVLGQVRHENELLNHRMTWLWALQGLLFNALGLLREEIALRYVICVVGMITCFSVWHGLRGGSESLKGLNKCAKELGCCLWECVHVKWDKVSCCELTHVEDKSWVLLPWNFLPLFLLGVWLVIAIYTGVFFGLPKP